MSFKLKKHSVMVLLLVVAGILFLPPSSRLFIGSRLKGSLFVQVNGESVVPTNITCTRGSGSEEKVKVSYKNEETIIKNNASLHDGYTYEFDIEDETGMRHFRFMVMKTHQFGPREEFWYHLSIAKMNEEWIANISIEDENGVGKERTVNLSEEGDTYIQLGP